MLGPKHPYRQHCTCSSFTPGSLPFVSLVLTLSACHASHVCQRLQTAFQGSTEEKAVCFSQWSKYYSSALSTSGWVSPKQCFPCNTYLLRCSSTDILYPAGPSSHAYVDHVMHILGHFHCLVLSIHIPLVCTAVL